MKGRLSVTVDTPSQLLGDTWTFEVRDARMRRAGIIRRQQSLELDPGLYRVSAVLEDGGEHEEIVEVHAGANSVAHFVAKPAGPGIEAQSASTAEDPAERWLLGDADTAAGAMRGLLPSDRFELSAAMAQVRSATRSRPIAGVDAGPGVRLEPAGTARWQVYAQTAGAHWARVALGARTWRVSLPTAAPGATRPSVELSLSARSDTWHPQARMAAWRTVASSLQELLGTGRMEHAFAVADRAAMLLADKYQDPVGAILGALLLQRTHQLERHRGWLDHLARQFPWWADATILSAVLDGDSADPAIRRRGLAVLLDPTLPRPCFTESHSLRLDSLRRWRDPDSASDRAAALQALTERYGDVDWDALTFTHSD